ncbi:stage III sporulation protein AB [Pelosinus sp. sgz500959]|uniref:stage III sporulation protein AB n=1 Tax=Pelosinus sp. sgz500959 TaxID=3242472 RepID=UPI00366E149F
MWLKIAGSMLVFFVSSCIGFKLAARCSGRPQQIRQVISCLNSLKSYITYASAPLHEALMQCAHGIHGPIADFFHHVGMSLEENSRLSPQQAIHAVLKQMKGELMFESSELEILGVLSANLGIMSRQEQGNYLSMVIEQLEKLENEATRLRDLNTKMYRYLGICGGAAIVILLV